MTDELERLALGCLLLGFDGTALPDWLRRRVREGLGGVILYARNIETRAQVVALTTALREARPDVLVGIDEEGGDVTRLEAKTGSSSPGNLALGVVDDLGLTQAVASSIGADLVSAGVNLDFAPVADVNSNPNNPIIGVRAFGDQPERVGAHVAAFVRGLQSAGVAACAKHFPGHGDTTVDSHRGLPTSEQTREQLAAGAFVPFSRAIDAGVASIMTAHLLMPALDTLPATISRRILSDILRSELGFDGMIVTDALDMGAISATMNRQTAAVLSLAAGADLICVGGDAADEAAVESLTRAIVDAVGAGRLTRERLADASARIRTVAETYPSTGSARPAAGGDRSAGEVARRAVRVVGSIAMPTTPVVVELRPHPTPAAGAVPWGIGDLLVTRDPSARIFRFAGPPADLEHVLRAAQSRSLIIVVRDLHRHAWVEAAVEMLIANHPDAVVIEMGLPVRIPAGVAAHIGTQGAARVNAQAAIELLYETRPDRASTERVHDRAAELDRLDIPALLALMHREDRAAVDAIDGCLDTIKLAVEAIVARLRRGGTLHYFGAGTSGRLAALDAIECPATFGISPELVTPHLAATDADEDDHALGMNEATAARLRQQDAVVGVSASGSTAYVRGAIEHARREGALTIALTCAPGSTLGRMAEIAIEVATGPELVAGSTRLKAGTAQKIVLNMISTAVFTQLGHVYRGRMIDVVPSNEKLRRRAAAIVRDVTGVSSSEAERALAAADGQAKVAVLMLQTGLSVDAARTRLLEGQGDLSRVLGESP